MVGGNFAAVIPAFNEADDIGEVVKKVNLYATPIVVNDGSSDNTEHFARRAGAIVINHKENLGYDAALQSGLFKAIEMQFQYAITLDADGQHSPFLIEYFKNELILGSDIVCGVRDHHQRFSETLFSWIGKIFWNIEDPLCGMKGYKLANFKNLKFFNSYHSIGTEYVIRCARTGLEIKNIPIPTRPRNGKSRFGSGLKSNYLILRALCLGIFLAR